MREYAVRIIELLVGRHEPDLTDAQRRTRFLRIAQEALWQAARHAADEEQREVAMALAGDVRRFEVQIAERVARRAE